MPPEEQTHGTTSSKKKVPSSRTTAGRKASGDKKLYALEVFLISGPITAKFAKKNPVISSTIQIRGDQTLDDLHEAISRRIRSLGSHMYEFQFGRGPMDPKGPRYVMGPAYETLAGKTKNWPDERTRRQL